MLVVVDVQGPGPVTECVMVYVPAAAHVIGPAFTVVIFAGPPVKDHVCVYPPPDEPVFVKVKVFPVKQRLTVCVKVEVTPPDDVTFTVQLLYSYYCH